VTVRSPAEAAQVAARAVAACGDEAASLSIDLRPDQVALSLQSPASAYAARRTAEGKSRRDIKRCLKRIIARQLFRVLERYDQPGVEVLRAA
jgi:hypothetical protein